VLRNWIKTSIFFCVLLSNSDSQECKAEDLPIATVEVREVSGISREFEYVDFSLQLPIENHENSYLKIVAIDIKNDKRIPCQIFNQYTYEEENRVLFQVIFPLSIAAYEKKNYILMETTESDLIVTDLSHQGKDLELIIENKFYQADLTKSDQSEAKNHSSGQLRELFIKMGYNIKLFRTENRMHWAPNFQNADFDHYETIAGWENPANYIINTGPYLIHTMRRDLAPKHPEILLTANYYFYAGLPVFRFYSSIDVTENVWLSLLRNDEMTMDSLFTHVAFQRSDGSIEDFLFTERYKTLEENPIENNTSWLCFYHAVKGYAFGSIRRKYDIKNEKGFSSPTYFPHTKISDGADGGKYWNRRLIHEYPLFIPKGSQYVEENVYLVFKIDSEKKFGSILKWAQIFREPLHVSLTKF
jgi:hypothetical protein